VSSDFTFVEPQLPTMDFLKKKMKELLDDDDKKDKPSDKPSDKPAGMHWLL
jgi:hypothetical protein